MTSNITLPDVRRVDAGLAVVDTVVVREPARQREVAETLLTADRPWNDGLLSDTVFLGTDGHTVLRYSQWTGEEALDGAAVRDPEPVERTVGVVSSVRHRLYRSAVPKEVPTPGIIVVVTFDTADAETGRRVVDALLDRHPATHPATMGTEFPEGMGGNHFHIALDGTQMVNWAEFTDELSHQRVVENQLRADDDVPRLIADTPGLTGRGFRRYLPHGTATPDGWVR
ncbi:hypothetical protein [Saccharomonospora cyanea]|uniref:Antibiotic biosynthesis monooxygenase n=1 Tax=Saccharomonospora cyanea NA-134 TaxID=882082 RepID=H5XI52_9PSEU|nr:hypothetical protein [Saccharomonospora cyanea]EHR60682.1 hypothetical protein SaccyDRAFT_1784 [Saccharomonospora cyanea NA-134]